METWYTEEYACGWTWYFEDGSWVNVDECRATLGIADMDYGIEFHYDPCYLGC